MLDFSVSERDMMWFRLALSFEPGSNRLFETYRKLGEDISRTYTYITENDNFKRTLTAAEKKLSETVTDETVEGCIRDCTRLGISIVTYGSKLYPASLRRIYNPPAALFCMGDVSLLSASPSLGVVGARKSSEYSLLTAERLIQALLKLNNFCIVSGFAIGTDIAAHLAAVRGGGKTIAVKGCGLDYNYPEQNMKYTGEILANGLLISEHPPGKAPKSMNFPIRNRIIAGLSEAVLVTEGGVRSGSLSTANLAVDFGKDVFVIPPHDIFDSRFDGNVMLLREGAIPIYNALDILIHTRTFISSILVEALAKARSDSETAGEIIGKSFTDIDADTYKEDGKKNDETDNNDNAETGEDNDETAAGDDEKLPDDSYYNADFSALDEDSLRIYNAVKVSPGEHNADLLAEEFSDTVLDILAELEMKKFIYRRTDGFYC
jgi:DNA processing protein